MNSELQKLVDNWLEWDQNEGTKREIAELVKSEKYDELRSRLTEKLVFGTAGIRCRMEAGFGRLNDLTIIQISHGMARYMNDVFGKMAKLSIAVGYDGRYNSKRFSELAATVFVSNGISVYMFSDVVPTPVVSFATVHFKCNAGLMITASHNPKEDNGYKVYWSNGAQILAPHDTEICRIAREESQPKSIYWKTEQLQGTPLFHSADSSLEFYYESESRMCYFRDVNAASPLKFTYSAFHGVGSKFTSELLYRYGVPSMNVFHVEEQDRPNPDFPTVPFPNPEEGHRVLELCIKTADRTNSSVILANDPDADRIQLAERQKDGRWRIFTGNEMGTILTWWIWKNWRKANSNADFSKVYILNSAVSSQIVKTIADKEGFLNRTTLTGFKWMGNVADEIRATGNTVILAWEESIGFMAGSTLDKDGVSTAAIFAEVANYLYVEENGAKLSDQLFKIYQEYGFHLVRSSYWIVPAASITKQVFADLRKDLQYPTSIGGDPIKSIRDLTTGYDNAQPDNKAILPISSSSEMVTFFLESGSVATLRASGTEPKIKYYIELKTPPGKNEKDIIDIMKTLDQLERDVVQTLLNPSHYGLFERSK